ncbi:MAG: hypothetical protein M1829_004030 [Trizodia sp. TS-e1964]|nr:MAG: hypothetical protein M1829_004030 [Trizodia sp. TS-e1964]
MPFSLSSTRNLILFLALSLSAAAQPDDSTAGNIALPKPLYCKGQLDILEREVKPNGDWNTRIVGCVSETGQAIPTDSVGNDELKRCSDFYVGKVDNVLVMMQNVLIRESLLEEVRYCKAIGTGLLRCDQKERPTDSGLDWVRQGADEHRVFSQGQNIDKGRLISLNSDWWTFKSVFEMLKGRGASTATLEKVRNEEEIMGFRLWVEGMNGIHSIACHGSEPKGLQGAI